MRTKTLAAAAVALAFCHAGAAQADPGRGHLGPYSLDVVDEAGVVLPTFQHQGRTYVLGALGRRYFLRVRNGSGRRVEVVVSVDGRDVIDGRPAAWDRRGYLVEARGELTIDGYRLSRDSVAAFRFSSVPRSYASRMGDARDVGVIGAAIFLERDAPPAPVAVPHRSPSSDGPAPEPPARSAESGASPAPSGSGPGVALGEQRRRDRPGLGTEFGEEHRSPVVEVPFQRARSRPEVVLAVRYDDRAGLSARGVDIDGLRLGSRDEEWLRETADPFPRNSFAEPPPGWSSPVGRLVP